MGHALGFRVDEVYAALVGVTEDTIINWEVRGVKPTGSRVEKVKEVLGI